MAQLVQTMYLRDSGILASDIWHNGDDNDMECGCRTHVTQHLHTARYTE
ncbi:hypothetical protein [Alteromonas antoniana]|nr:hypothetical protein [Alteromonas antoniana]